MKKEDTQDMKNQDDVKPGSALEDMILNDESDEVVKTDGTGSNRPIYNDDSLIIERDESEPDSLGIDLDGTNPDVRKD